MSINPLKLMSALWNGSTGIAAGAVRVAQGVAELAAGLARPAPSSTLNGPVSSLRRYSTARVSLRDITQVCRRVNVTINDVALAAITESYREMLIRRGEQPLPDSLRILVPVSTRSSDALHVTDNRVSVMLPYLPVEEENALGRLLKVNARLDRTKSHGQREAGTVFRFGRQPRPVPGDRVGGAPVDPATAARGGDLGDECARAA